MPGGFASAPLDLPQPKEDDDDDDEDEEDEDARLCFHARESEVS